MKVLAELEKKEGVSGVDFDPTKYRDRDEPKLCLLEEGESSASTRAGSELLG